MIKPLFPFAKFALAMMLLTIILPQSFVFAGGGSSPVSLLSVTPDKIEALADGQDEIILDVFVYEYECEVVTGMEDEFSNYMLPITNDPERCSTILNEDGMFTGDYSVIPAIFDLSLKYTIVSGDAEISPETPVLIEGGSEVVTLKNEDGSVIRRYLADVEGVSGHTYLSVTSNTNGPVQIKVFLDDPDPDYDYYDEFGIAYDDRDQEYIKEEIIDLTFGEGGGLPATTEPLSDVFDDLSESHANFDAIKYVKDEGIVVGYSDGTYGPSKQINRAEFTKIIVEAVYDEDLIENCIDENADPDLSYLFFPDIPKDEWFSKYVCVAYQEEVVSGYPDGTYKAAQSINFVEAAKIITNAFGHETEEDEVWYRPFVEILDQENAIPTSISNFDKKITRGDMAEIIYRLMEDITDKSSNTYGDLS